MSGYPYSQRAAQKPPTQFLEIEVLLTFAKYVGGAVYVSVCNPAVGKLIQATMDTLNSEGSRIRLVRDCRQGYRPSPESSPWRCRILPAQCIAHRNARIGHASRRIFKPDIDSKNIVNGNVLRFFLLKVAIMNLEVSAVIYGANTNFLDSFVLQSIGERYPESPAAVQSGEFPAHGNGQESVLDVYDVGRKSRVEHTAFFSIVRHLDALEAVFS